MFEDSIIVDLHVTQAVIDRGVQEDGENCPIGIALTEALRAKGYHDIDAVEVGGAGLSFSVEIGYNRYFHRIKSMNEANFIDDFIRAFDNFTKSDHPEPVKPFDLTIELFLQVEEEDEEDDYDPH